MRRLNMYEIVIQFDDLDFTEEELSQEKMSDLIKAKYRQKINNMANEKFTVKISWLAYARKLKHGEQMTNKNGYAPECLEGKYDHRADVWSFGQVAYRLMIKE